MSMSLIGLDTIKNKNDPNAKVSSRQELQQHKLEKTNEKMPEFGGLLDRLVSCYRLH